MPSSSQLVSNVQSSLGICWIPPLTCSTSKMQSRFPPSGSIELVEPSIVIDSEVSTVSVDEVITAVGNLPTKKSNVPTLLLLLPSSVIY